MTSRLYQLAQGTISSTFTTTLTFPPVPQGLVWTGSVFVVTAVDALNSALVTARWVLEKSGQVVSAWGGSGILYDVQAYGQDRMSISGIVLNPGISVGTQLLAYWVGRSDDQGTEPVVSPRVYGSPSETAIHGVVDIEAASPTALPVQDNGLYPTALAASVLGAGAGSTTALVAATPGTTLRLWEVGVSAYCGGAASGQFQCHVQDTTGAVDYCTAMAFNAAGGEGTSSLHMPWHGLTLPAGAGIRLVCSASAATITGASANVLYSIV